MATIDLGRHTVDLTEWREEVRDTERGPQRVGKAVKIGSRSGSIVMTVDPAKLVHKAKRALLSGRGKTTLVDGAIVISVVKETLRETRD